MKRIAWMFYYHGSEIYKQQLSVMHGEWVEQKVMKIFNIQYVHVNELTVNQRSCVQQLYSKRMNDLRTNMLRRNKAFLAHQSQIRKEQPKESAAFSNNFRREKTVFFSTRDLKEKEAWMMVNIDIMGGPHLLVKILTKW